MPVALLLLVFVMVATGDANAIWFCCGGGRRYRRRACCFFLATGFADTAPQDTVTPRAPTLCGRVNRRQYADIAPTTARDAIGGHRLHGCTAQQLNIVVQETHVHGAMQSRCTTAHAYKDQKVLSICTCRSLRFKYPWQSAAPP